MLTGYCWGSIIDVESEKEYCIMSAISNECNRISSLLLTIRSGFRNAVEGLGFGVMCMMVYLIPLGVAYLIYQLLV